MDFSVFNPLFTFLTYDAENPLMFSSKRFLLLFVVFLIIFNIIRKSFNARVLFIALFSAYFYYLTSGTYLWLLLIISVTDHSIGFWLNCTSRKSFRKLLVALSLLVDLGILCYFKYTNFACSLIAEATNQTYVWKDIFLPVGISFYIFQSLSYVIDIYRRRIQPTEKWVDYVFYLSFFPQLVAGPIVKARDFLPQIVKKPIPTLKMFNMGLLLILAGLVKKIVISDYISVNFVDRVFDNPLQYSGFENLIGAYAYTLQIYCDFSGYSDMAIGIAYMLGFRFPMNFRLPFQSATITEFWRRWHISLSSWLRDYLYISLGGNRKGKIRMYVNLMVTMLLGGLWHGADLRFILWGGLHGLALCVHKLWLRLFPKMKKSGEEMKPINRLFSTFLTFHFVCFCFLFFRASDTETVWTMLYQIQSDFRMEMVTEIITSNAMVMSVIGIGFMLHFLPKHFTKSFILFFFALPIWLKAVLAVLVIWLVVQLQSNDVRPFIYFQF